MNARHIGGVGRELALVLALCSPYLRGEDTNRPTQVSQTNAAQAAVSGAAPTNYPETNVNFWLISKTISPGDLKKLESLAEAGEAAAQCELGLRYYRGYGVARNDARAWELARQSANKSYPPAQVVIAELYLEKPFREESEWQTNAAKAVECLQKAADEGYEVALRELGKAYEQGQIVRSDLEKAEAIYWKWYAIQKTNNSSWPGGENSLSVLANNYLKGKDAPKNVEKAVTIYTKLGEGNPYYHWVLALIYETGDGVEKDLVIARLLYEKAAARGHIMSMARLAAIYLGGEGVSRDIGKALKLYEKAAAQGDSESLFDLAMIYRGGDLVRKDAARAAGYLQKLVVQDNDYHKRYGCEHKHDLGLKTRLLGMRKLASMYRQGEGVSKDLAKTRELYERVAKHGDVGVQFYVGHMFADGEGGEADLAKAVEYWKLIAVNQAAEPEYAAEAEYSLGAAFYGGGPGVAQDYAEAAKWFRVSAEHGQPDAQFYLGVAYHNGNGVPKDEAEACKWIRKAAEQGNRTAQFNLGVACFNGKGVPKDDVEAYKWYNLAAAQGHSNAVEARDSLARQMTPQQIAEAQRLAREFRPRKAAADHSAESTPDADASPAAGGTGFFVTDDGYLLTSYHVVENGVRVVVRTGGKQNQAKLVKADKANDVALLKVSGSFRALPIGTSRGVKLGESVFTVGFPNTEIQGVEPKLTRGEINSLSGAQDDPRKFQISAAVQPGNSGGPLVNQYGNVVGIVESRLADIATLKATGSLPQNVNYAVKSSVLNVLLESLPEVSAKLKEPYPAKERKFEDVVQEAQDATALVLVY